jgi:hypothetical protein
MGAVAAGAIAFAVLVLIVAAMVWQANRRRDGEETALYLMDEATDFVVAAVAADVAGRLGEDGVRRILEWSTHHSQVVVARGDGPPVLGGPAAVDYVAGRAAASGRGYLREDVAAVLTAESAYLVAIGAVGDRVEEEPA